MSSLNEKGRRLLIQTLNILHTGFIYKYMGPHKTEKHDEIPIKIIETCRKYTDPTIIWIANKVFIRLHPTKDYFTLITPTGDEPENESVLKHTLSADSKRITITNTDSENANQSMKFDCEYIYNSDSTLTDILNRTGKPLIDLLLNGYNTALVSYGHNDSGAKSILFGPNMYDPFDRNRKRKMKSQNSHTQCIIGDNGLYQLCLQYLFSELNDKISNNKQLLNFEITVQHIYTYPDMELLEDALKYTESDKKSKRRSTKPQLKIRSRNAFDVRNDTRIYIENARSLLVNNYSDIKQVYQTAHNNIFSSQLKYVNIERSEAKSNYEQYRHSINQIISIDLNQYFNDGTLYDSNLKFVIPKYYNGQNNMYETVLSHSNSLPASNYHKSAVIYRSKSDNNGRNKLSLSLESDPLFTVCSALSKDLMPRYKNDHFTHLCKDVLGGNCKTLFLVNCVLKEKYKMESIKCLKFAKLLRLIYNNPRLNIQSIKEWANAYNALRCKYEKLYNDNRQKNRKSSSMTPTMSPTFNNSTPTFKSQKMSKKSNNKVLMEVRDDKRVIKQGYLNKEGGIIKNIKVRYFVLFQDRKLLYFDDMLSKQAIGVIDIRKDFEKVEMSNWLKEENGSHNFQGFILTTKQRKWKLGTGSINDVKQWVKVLKKAGSQK